MKLNYQLTVKLRDKHFPNGRSQVRTKMISSPFINMSTRIKIDTVTRMAYRHQVAALVLCLCITNEMLKVVHCGIVRPNTIRRQHANAAEHVALETTQTHITGDMTTKRTFTKDPGIFQNVHNLQWRTFHTAAVKVLLRICIHKLNSVQQERVLRHRLLHGCVHWTHKHAPQEFTNKPLQRKTFDPDTGVGHMIKKDSSVSVRWKTYSGSHGGKRHKLNYRQIKYAKRFVQHTRSRSKRAPHAQEPATFATDTYDARGITLTPRTFYTFYNKSAAKFTRDEQLVPVKITTPTNSPPSPAMLRTSGLTEWKTVSLQNTKTHSNSMPPGGTNESQSFVTSIQSPASVVTTTNMEQSTTPLSLVDDSTTAPPRTFTMDRTTTDMSTTTSTASPLDGSSEVSTITEIITEAELVNTLNQQNSTNSFSTNIATTDKEEDSFQESTMPMLPNITAGDTTISSQAEQFGNEDTTPTTFENMISTPNQTENITYDNNNTSSSPSSPTSIKTTAKQTITTNTMPTTTLETTTTHTTKTNQPTTTVVVTAETITTQQHMQVTTMSPTTTTLFPLVTTRRAKNVTNASPDHLSSTTIAGITTGSLAIFWLFLGPLVCLICHIKDREKNQRKRQKEDELGHKLVNELIRSELAKGRGKLYKTEVKDNRELEPLPPGANGTGPVSPVCVTVV